MHFTSIPLTHSILTTILWSGDYCFPILQPGTKQHREMRLFGQKRILKPGLPGVRTCTSIVSSSPGLNNTRIREQEVKTCIRDSFIHLFSWLWICWMPPVYQALMRFAVSKMKKTQLLPSKGSQAAWGTAKPLSINKSRLHRLYISQFFGISSVAPDSSTSGLSKSNSLFRTQGRTQRWFGGQNFAGPRKGWVQTFSGI